MELHRIKFDHFKDRQKIKLTFKHPEEYDFEELENNIEEIGEGSEYHDCGDYASKQCEITAQELKKLSPTQDPQNGDLILYKGAPEMGGHYGVIEEINNDNVENSWIISKFGKKGKLYKHRLWAILPMYGDMYEFLKTPKNS